MSIEKSKVARVLDVQKKIIAQDGIPQQYRELLKDNLEIISQLNTELKKLKNDTTVGAIREMYSAKTGTQADELVTLIGDVQKHLSTNHTSLLIKSVGDNEKREELETIITNYIRENKITSTHFPKLEDLVNFLSVEILGLSVLEEAFTGENADDIEEIQINDYNDIRFIVNGKEEMTKLSFRNPDHLRLLVDRLTRNAGKDGGQVENLSETRFYIRLRYGDTTRISVMSDPVARRPAGSISGPVIQMAIRKQRTKPFDKNFLLSKGSINEFGDALLELLVKYGVSINAYGGTGTGKTAMLRRYLGSIPPDKRVITMAEVDEMNLRQLDMNKYIIKDGTKIDNPDYLRPLNSALMWECTNPDTPIFGNLKGFSGLVNASLTFTPEVIVLQESKSGEIKDVIEAAISGHQVFTTIHANSPEAFFLRILLMYQQAAANISDSLILKQIPLAFPVIVNFRRYPDGSRKIAEITELIGFNAVTQSPVTRPLLRYVVKSNTRDPITGNLKMEGEFVANAHTMLSDNLIRILKDGGMEDAEFQYVKSLYETINKQEFKVG